MNTTAQQIAAAKTTNSSATIARVAYDNAVSITRGRNENSYTFADGSVLTITTTGAMRAK